MKCAVVSCAKDARTRGWCKQHYLTWWRRGGNPGVWRENMLSPEQQFWRKVDKSEECWIWTGYRDGRGYGSFRTAGHTLAHRFAYELLIGPIPLGMELDHLCRTPACVNPSHLQPVTHAENVRRGMAGKLNNWQARKTHCSKGHPFDEVNTYWYLGKYRECRTCHRISEHLRNHPLV